MMLSSGLDSALLSLRQSFQPVLYCRFLPSNVDHVTSKGAELLLYALSSQIWTPVKQQSQIPPP